MFKRLIKLLRGEDAEQRAPTRKGSPKNHESFSKKEKELAAAVEENIAKTVSTLIREGVNGNI